MKSLILFFVATCARTLPAPTCVQQCQTLTGCADEVTLDRCVQDCSVDVAIGAMDLDLVGLCEGEARYQRAIAPSRPAR